MKVRRRAEFRADVPEEEEEDQWGNAMFGRSLAAAVTELLRGLGYRVSPPDWGGDHGWEIEFWASERRFWCQVSYMESYLLLCEDMGTPLRDRASRGLPHPIYVEVLTRLDSELRRDPRFHDLAWYFDDEVDSGLPGASTPVCASVPVGVGSWVEFQADFPEETEEDRQGNLVLGRACAEAVAGMLDGVGRGMSRPARAGDGHWAFGFRALERRFSCQVSKVAEGYQVACKDIGRTVIDQLFKRPPSAAYVEIMSRLNGALLDDPRFRDITWLSPDDVRSAKGVGPTSET